MMSLSTQLALEDVGALLLGPSFLMADPMGPLLDQDEEEALSPFSPLSSEGRAPPSPPLSFSSSSSPSPPPSPPPAPCHPSLFRGKTGADLLSFPWLGASDLLDIHVGADDGGDDAFSGMDWMAEKIDLSDFDLDSLMGSCVSDDPPGSPEELLASLEMDHLDHFAPAPPAHPEAPDLGPPLAALPPELPAAGEGVDAADPVPEAVTVKSEPPSPAPSLPLPLSPAHTLELGSEVDVLDVGKISSSAAVVPEPGGSPQVPVLISPFMVVLTPKDEGALLPAACPSSSASSDSESDSGIDSVSDSPPHHSSSPSPSPSSSGSSRTKPYSKPPPSSSSSSLTPKVKSVSSGGAPKVVEKKLKKMEQNKTAATRYRQKKRVEQDVLNGECSELETRNRELSEKADSISREIQYLRDLMEEVRSAKSRRAGAKSGGGGVA